MLYLRTPPPDTMEAMAVMGDPEHTTPPTYYANVATIHLTVDEVTLEFRRIMLPHLEIAKVTEGGSKPQPPLTDEELYALPVLAKVVLSFSGAKALLQNMSSLFPQIEKARLGG